MSINENTPDIDELIMQIVLLLGKEYHEKVQEKMGINAHDEDNLFIFNILKKLILGKGHEENIDIQNENRLLHLITIIRLQLQLDERG